MKKKTVTTRKPYSQELIAKAKLLFVQEGKSALEIANFIEGPSHQTISNWAKKKSSSGKTWIVEREEYQHALYENLSPAAQVNKILEKINVLISKDSASFSTKDADALAKLQKLITTISDKKYHIPAMFDVLTELIKFFKQYYPQFLTKEFLIAVKHFKNQKINEAQK